MPESITLSLIVREHVFTMFQMKVEDGLLQREIHARMQAQQVVEEPAQETRKKLLRSMSAVHRMVDAQRSDEMDAEGGLADTLQKIVESTMPCPRFVKYHEQHLQRHLSLLGNYPPRQALSVTHVLVPATIQDPEQKAAPR